MTGLAFIVGCSGNVIHLNGQKKLIGLNSFDTGNKIVGLHNIDAGNKLVNWNAFDAGNKVIGLSSFDTGNKLIGLNSFDTGNKIIGLNAFDSGNKMVGLHSIAAQPASFHVGTARGFGNVGLSSVSMAQPMAIDNSGLFLDGNANARSIHLMNAAPAISTFGARQLNLGHVSSPAMIMAGRSADQVVATQAVSADVKPVTAAVATVSRTVDYTPMAYSGEPAKTQVVNVPPNEQGLHINFFSKSSPLTVSQQHIPGDAGQVQVTESVDEPQRLVHNVKKSVIQEVNEVVQPFRVLKQEVKPVIEQAHTLVAEGNKIPLSGRSSGVIATENVAPAMGLIHRPTQVITAHEPRAMKIAAFAEPAAAEIALAAPAAMNIATIAQPRSLDIAVAEPRSMGLSIAEPRGFGVATIAQPRALGLATIAQPAAISGMGLSKFAISQPVSTGGSLFFQNTNPSMLVQKRNMMIHQQPSMLIQHKNFGMPMTSSFMNTRTFNKPLSFATENMKFQRF